MYVIEYDEEDLWRHLHQRTQGEEEKVTEYISSLRYIAMHFREPLSDAELVRTAYRNLHPEYRQAFFGKAQRTMAELRERGSQYERQKELDQRWSAPPPAAQIAVSGAAYRKSSSRTKPSVATVSSASNASGADSVNKLNAEAADGWQTVSKRKRSRGGNNKSQGAAARQPGAGLGGDEAMLTGQVNAVMAAGARSAPQQQQMP